MSEPCGCNSFVLACDKGYMFDLDTGEIFLDQPVVLNDVVVNQSVIFIILSFIARWYKGIDQGEILITS